MEITTTIIKAVANTFPTTEALQEALNKAVSQMLENPDAIVSASTGAGASYSKQITMTAQDLVELLSYALEYKETGLITTDGSNIHYSFTWIV